MLNSATRPWTTATIADVASAAQRSIAIGPFGSDLKADLYTSTGFPVVRGQDITDGNYLDESNLVYVPQAVADSLPACVVSKGDLIFPHRGAIGKVGIVGDQEFLLSSSLMKLTVNSDIIDPEFAFYYFRGPGRRELMARASTVGTPGISQPLRSLRSITITFPGLPEQRAIAGILGALDDKIGTNSAVSRTAEELLVAEFKKMGVDDEPCDFGSSVSLAEVVELNPHRARPVEDEPVYVSMQKIPVSGISIPDWATRPARGGVRFRNGDTLLARITPCLQNRKTGFVDFLNDGQVAIGSTEYIVLRSRPQFPTELSYFIATSQRFRSFAIRRMIGTSGRQRVSAGDIANFRLSAPDPAILQRFGQQSSTIFSLVGSLRDESRTLGRIRDVLLPLLMAGRIRIGDVENVVEEVL